MRNAYILLKGVLDENVKEREKAEKLKKERRLDANKKQED